MLVDASKLTIFRTKKDAMNINGNGFYVVFILCLLNSQQPKCLHLCTYSHLGS